MLEEDRNSRTNWTGSNNPLNPEKGHTLARSLGNLHAVNGVFKVNGNILKTKVDDDGNNRKYGTRMNDLMIHRGIACGYYRIGKNDLIYEMDMESRKLLMQNKIPRVQDVKWSITNIYY